MNRRKRLQNLSLNNVKYTSAFSLIELSIVIVIMGLLVSATMVGQGMIRSAELRGAISEIENFRVATDSFKGQYSALPGDLKNANSIWAATSSGNGNGKIDYESSVYEMFNAWEQLQLARMIDGNFDGTGTTPSTANVPSSSYITGGIYGLKYTNGATTTEINLTDSLGRALSGNYVVFGGSGASETYPSIAILTPDDAKSIDSKIDDGTPDYGKVIGMDIGVSGAGNCFTGSAPNFVYSITYTLKACYLWINLSQE